MSDTPRTDAVAFAVGRRLMSPKTVVVAVNDARKLELELAAVTEERDALQAKLDMGTPCLFEDGKRKTVEDLAAERDEALHRLAATEPKP